MEILQVNKRHWDHLGGIETVVRMAFEVFRESGHSTTILAINETSNTEIEESEKLKVVKAGQMTILFGMPVSWKFFLEARKQFRTAGFIFLHHPFPLGFLAYVLFGRGKPAAIWYHSDIIRQKLLARMLYPLFSWVFRKASVIIITSDRMTKQANLLKKYVSKTAVIPYAVKDNNAKQSHNKSVNLPSTLSILSVGRLVYYKGFEYLIEAMDGVNAQLLIIGTGPLKNSLTELVRQKGLTNVALLNPVEDLSEYYKACDIFVLPSIENSEAFGLVQVEAMLAAKPVINTNLPTSVPNVSIHGQTGLTVEPRDVEGLRTAINGLLDNPGLRFKYGRAAKERAQSEYGMEVFKTRLSNLLEKSNE